MSVVDSFVEDSIRRYPSLFKSRGDVLHHALAVLGNGYVWRDGEVFEEARDFEDYAPAPYASLEVYSARYRSQFGHANGEFFDVDELALEAWGRDSVVIDRISEAVQDESFSFIAPGVEALLAGSFYPQHEYALMCNVPEDVHPDWLEAVRFMRAAAESYGWVFDDVV